MKTNKSADDPPANSGDIMRGVEAIADFINKLSEEPVTRKQVYGWISKGLIPSGKLGKERIASKRRIREAFERITAGG